MTIWPVHSGRALRGAAAFVFLACPAALSAQRQKGVLVGRVLSGDVAVPGATIYASGGRVTLAREDGRFRMSLPAGRYEVRAQRIGYSSARTTVVIVDGASATANFKLERPLSRLQAVAAVGAHGEARTVFDAPMPIDVFSGEELRATGRTETAEMIQSLAPYITVPHATVAEGSDLVHPAMMRGLGPDQVLVLVNGKRRHASALLNVNRSLGRGSDGTDLNAIPASMIDHVEIMRDGAVARYGSGAVAGVINIVLKSGVHGDATTTMGEHVTTANRSDDASPSFPDGEASARDGRRFQASIDKGIVFGEGGFLHGDFEIRDRGYTNRALPASPALGEGNRSGDAASHDLALFFNGGNRLANGVELYGNVGGSRRTMEAATRFRAPSVPFPAGYLPIIRPTLNDYAGTAGLKGRVDDWAWDLGTTYGRNRVEYDVKGTTDLSSTTLGQFDAGAVHAAQSTTTFELSTHLGYFDDTRLTTGAELRRESYGISASASQNGGAFIQGFPGFGPNQVVDRSRHDLGAFVDLEVDLTPSFLVGLAGRVEDYSDVGTTGAGKLSLRWEPASHVALRGSVGRGSRAPSLAESNYGARPGDRGTSELGQAIVRVDQIGSPLRPERSTNYAVGIALERGDALSFAADAYRVDVKDRTILLDDVALPGVGVPYFVRNGIDTRTDGLEVSANYGLRFENMGTLRLVTALSVDRTTVTNNATAGQPLGLGTAARTLIERGQPRSSLLGSASYKAGAFGALLRAQRFGEVTAVALQAPALAAQSFGARWTTDANLSYTLLRKYTLTAGADNVFDVYPDRNNVPGSAGVAGNGYFGTMPYNAVSPFGFNGRFVYGKLSIYL